MMTELPDVMTIEEAAIALRVSDKTVRRMLADGRLHGTNLGRTWRIPKEAVAELLGASEHATIVFVVQSCIVIGGQEVAMFNSVHATLEGAKATLERVTRARGQELVWEDRGDLKMWSARTGTDRYIIAATALHD